MTLTPHTPAAGGLLAGCPDPDTLAGWLESSANGDYQAFRQLYDTAAPLLNTLLVHTVLSRTDAEDLLVEVFAKVWIAAGSYDRARGPALAWMAVIARHHALDHLRRGRRRAEVEARVAEESKAQADPADLGSLAEERDRLRHAVRTLPRDQREAIRVVFFEGLSHAQAAERLNQPLGTLKGRVRSALRHMRGHLDAPSRPPA